MPEQIMHHEGRHIIPNDDDDDDEEETVVIDTKRKCCRKEQGMNQESCSPIRSNVARRSTDDDHNSCVRDYNNDLSNTAIRRKANTTFMSRRRSYPPPNNYYTSTSSMSDVSVYREHHYLNSTGRGTTSSKRVAMEGRHYSGQQRGVTVGVMLQPPSHFCAQLPSHCSGKSTRSSSNSNTNNSTTLNILRYNRYMSHHIGSCVIMQQVRRVHEGLYQLDKYRIEQQVQNRKRKQEQALLVSSNEDSVSLEQDSEELVIDTEDNSGENSLGNKRYKSILSDESAQISIRGEEQEEEDSEMSTSKKEKEMEEYESQVDEDTNNKYDEVDSIEYTRQAILNQAIRMKRMSVLFRNMHQIQRELEKEVMEIEQNSH